MVVPATMFTGLEKLTCCQPLDVSFVDVADASKAAAGGPEINHMGSRCSAILVKTDSSNLAVAT